MSRKDSDVDFVTDRQFANSYCEWMRTDPRIGDSGWVYIAGKSKHGGRAFLGTAAYYTVDEEGIWLTYFQKSSLLPVGRRTVAVRLATPFRTIKDALSELQSELSQNFDRLSEDTQEIILPAISVN